MLNQFNYGSPVLQAIVNRKERASFSSLPISKTSIETLLDSGMRISSKSVNDLWSYVVIQDEFFIDYLRECALVLNRIDSANEYSENQDRNKVSKNIMNGSPSIIAVCANLTLPFSIDDCWLSVENLLLTGSALGFCVTMDGSLLKVLNLSNVKSKLSIPNELTVLAAIYVGEPENSALPPVLRSPKIWKWI